MDCVCLNNDVTPSSLDFYFYVSLHWDVLFFPKQKMRQGTPSQGRQSERA